MASFSFSPCCIVCTVWVVQVWQVELLSCRHLSPFHLSLNLGLLQKRFLSLVTRWTKPVFQTLISFSSLRQCANRREPEYLTLTPAGVLMMTSNFRSVSGAVRCSLHFFFHPTGEFHQGKDHPVVNPSFPWGYETQSRSALWAEVKSWWPSSVESQWETYFFQHISHFITYQISQFMLVMVPTGPLRTKGRTLCLAF